MSSLPYFPLYAGDWLSSPEIMLMTPAQEGAYIRLLCLCWKSDDCMLKANAKQLLAFARLACKEDLDVVLDCFEEKDGKIYNKRLLEEHEKAINISESRAKAGSIGGKARQAKAKQMPSKRQAIAKQMPVYSDSYSDSYSNTDTKPNTKEENAPSLDKQVSAPAALLNMDLYKVDKKLCRDWDMLYKSWEVAYPGVDILAEVAKAHAWEVANPTKRKLNKPKFLANWLARQQDKAGNPHKVKSFAEIEREAEHERMEAFKQYNRQSETEEK